MGVYTYSSEKRAIGGAVIRRKCKYRISFMTVNESESDLIYTRACIFTTIMLLIWSHTSPIIISCRKTQIQILLNFPNIIFELIYLQNCNFSVNFIC